MRLWYFFFEYCGLQALCFLLELGRRGAELLPRHAIPQSVDNSQHLVALSTLRGWLLLLMLRWCLLLPRRRLLLHVGIAVHRLSPS